MRLNDLIEIVTNDHTGKLHIRRVRVNALRRVGNRFQIEGVNLQGKYGQSYVLPVKPLTHEEVRLERSETVNWIPFNSDEEIDP